MNSAEARNSAAYARYLGLTALLLVVIAVGYLGFRQFATEMMPRMGALNLLALAVIAGIAGFFSPCAFPLLSAYLSFYAKARGHIPQPVRPTRSLRLGLAAAAGVVTFNLMLGMMIGLLGAGAGRVLSISGPEPSQFVRWFRGSVGLVLIGLGVMQWLNINLKPGLVADALAWHTRPDRESQKPAVTFYLYGLGYNAAGMSVPVLSWPA